MGSSSTDDSATISDGSTTKTDSDSETETDEECRSFLDSRQFEVGERVLAYHQNLIYEAKVIKLEFECSSKQWRYLVHYPGWKKRWDEWLGKDLLLKFTDENVEKQKAASMLDMQARLRAGRVARIKAGVVGPVARHKANTFSVAMDKKRKKEGFDKEKNDAPLEKFGNLQIPLTLKKQLIDDCEFITHLGKLVKLPRTPNVEDILQRYSDYRLRKDGLNSESVKEFLKGLRDFFNKALQVMLLYKNERQQFDDLIRYSISPSDVYGAEHLLRLFVKLPELLANSNIEEETLAEVQERLIDFLKFLHKNQSNFFLSTYHVPEDTETSTNKQYD